MYFLRLLRLFAAEMRFLARRWAWRVAESLWDLRPRRPFCSVPDPEDCLVFDREHLFWGISKLTASSLRSSTIVCSGDAYINKSALTTVLAGTCPIDTAPLYWVALWEERDFLEFCDYWFCVYLMLIYFEFGVLSNWAFWKKLIPATFFFRGLTLEVASLKGIRSFLTIALAFFFKVSR